MKATTIRLRESKSFKKLVEQAAAFRDVTASEFIRGALVEAMEQARAAGWGAKAIPVPKDGRRGLACMHPHSGPMVTMV